MGCPTYIISVHHRPADAVKLEHISLYIRMFSSCPLCVCVCMHVVSNGAVIEEHLQYTEWETKACGTHSAEFMHIVLLFYPLAKLYYIHTLTMCYCSFKCLAKVSARLCVQANAQFIICISVCVCGEGGDGGGWAVGRTSVCECRRRHCSEKERLRPDQMLENRNAPEFIQSLCVERTTVLHTVHVRNDCDCDTNRGETV